MNKKIDIPVLRERIIWTVTMCVIAILMVASIQRKVNSEVSKLIVNIEPLKGKKNLIGPQEVRKTINDFLGVDVENVNVNNLNINELEELFIADKRVKLVDLYVDGKSRLNVDLKQRVPLVRIMDGSNKSYYLDEDGNQVPVVKNSAIRVPLATGQFELYEEQVFRSEKPYRLRQVFNLAKKIKNDPFMEALVEQIDVNEKGDLVVLPKIGRHEIVLGDDKDLDTKFDNLKIMYKEGLPREGWRKYHTLLLNYKGQVIGCGDEEEETIPVIEPSVGFVDASVEVKKEPVDKKVEKKVEVAKADKNKKTKTIPAKKAKDQKKK
jgi:cell division protein FtsQ